MFEIGNDLISVKINEARACATIVKWKLACNCRYEEQKIGLLGAWKLRSVESAKYSIGVVVRLSELAFQQVLFDRCLLDYSYFTGKRRFFIKINFN